MSETPHDALLLQGNAALRRENQALRQQIEALAQAQPSVTAQGGCHGRKLFGKTSENLDPRQLRMVFVALKNEPPDGAKKEEVSDWPTGGSEAAATPAGSFQGVRKKRSLEEMLQGLPVTEIIIDPEAIKADPAVWVCIGAGMRNHMFRVDVSLT